MDCCIDIEIDCPASAGREETPKARVIHRCGECKRQIMPGEHYHLDTLLNDGKWDRYKQCRECREIAEVLFCGTWHYGEVWYDLRDYVVEFMTLPWDAVAKMSPAAREKVLALVEENWNEEENNQ